MNYEERYNQQFEDLKQMMLICGESLKSFDYENSRFGEIIKFCLNIEEDLFRARMKAEITINWRNYR